MNYCRQSPWRGLASIAFLNRVFFQVERRLLPKDALKEREKKKPRAWVQIVPLEMEMATRNSCIARKRKGRWLGLTTNGLTPIFPVSISECLYRNQECLIAVVWERRVQPPRFVVLSDTVFRSNSQQGELEWGLKCQGKWCRMSN